MDNFRKWLPIIITAIGTTASIVIDLYFRNKQEKNGLKLDKETTDAIVKGLQQEEVKEETLATA